MDVMKRRGFSLRHLAAGAVGGVLAAALVHPVGIPAAEADIGSPHTDAESPGTDVEPSQTDVASPQAAATPAQGDALVTNYSFEDGLTSWSLTDGYGEAADDSCAEALSTSADWSSAGDVSLLIGADRSCRQAGALSESTPVEAGQTYTAWADVHDGRIAWLGLHWVDAGGAVIDSEHTRRDVRSDRLKLSAQAPQEAAGVQVEVGAIGELGVDNVLLSAQYTALGAQVVRQPRMLSGHAGVDENGRDVIWSMGTGSEDDPGILLATDVLTGEVTRAVQLPGVTGGWEVNQNPVTGTVYVGTYGAAALWLYTPGEDEAVNAGTPDIPHWNFAYDIAFDEEGNAYGGGWGEPTDGYPGASVYTFTEGEGFTGVLGELPLTEEANYTRALGYDEASRTVFVGTGNQVNLFACHVDTDECENLAPLFDEEIQDSVEVRTIVVSEGYVLAWAGDAGSTGNDWLVVLDVDRSADGELQAEVVDEIRGVAYPGASPIIDGQIYYTKAGHEDWPLFRYTISSGEETQLPEDVVILARQWDIVELDDPAWPGATLVGLNSYGFLTRYNIETEEISVEEIEGMPEVSVRVNSLATGPEGSIWSSGYLQGGIGRYTPMREDAQEAFELGGQAEQMLGHDGRIFQGAYPRGEITSFTPAQLRAEEEPTVECEVGAGQNRPYALHSSGDRLYYGSQAGSSGADTGAFGWFDAATGECHTIEGPIGHQSVDTLAGSGDRIFGGGNIFYGYTELPKQDEASVMVFDESTEEIEEVALPVPGLRAVSAATTAEDGTVWFYAEGWLLAMDPQTLEWVHTEEVFGDLDPGGRIGGNYAQLAAAEDGMIYGNVDGRVYGFDPAATVRTGSAASHLEVLYRGAGPHLTIDSYGNLYTRLGATEMLRIVPEHS